MKRGTEFHIKPEKEDFTLTKIRESFNGEVTPNSFRKGRILTGRLGTKGLLGKTLEAEERA